MIYVAILIVAYLISYRNFDRIIEHQSEYQIKSTELAKQVILDSYYRSFNFFFSTRIDRKEIIQIIEEANVADSARQEELRKILLEKLTPLYQELTQIDVKYMQFFLKDNKTFLRF
jgi:hypothetical protein